MDSLNNNRPSGIQSIIDREKIDHVTTTTTTTTDRPYSRTSTVAGAAAVVSPTSMYSNPPPPYTGWSAPTVGHLGSGLPMPPDSRRASDNKTEPPPPRQTSQPQLHPHRQSLPSIHEALSNGPKPNSYVSPISASLQTQHPAPYSQLPPPSGPRSYPPSEHPQYSSQPAPPQQLQRQPSPPPPVHPQPAPFARPEPGPGSFPESLRHPSISATTAPYNPYAGTPGPRYEATSRYEPDPRAQERVAQTVAYTQHPPSSQSAYSYGPGPMQPPSQQHAPVYVQQAYPPRDPRDPRDTGEPWKCSREGEKNEPPFVFRHGIKRSLEVWDFENNLAEINISSNALHEWSSHYNAIAQEQQRTTNAVPDRMPSLDSVQDMLRHSLKITNALNSMQSIIQDQENTMREQRMREQGRKLPGEYEDEASMYGDDMKTHGYGSEGKKRRGRAAPPGRCHSCNRAETPEWRRGPDGARTLCNACGLHYAKLTRKNTMKHSQGSNVGSSLRPKSMDDHSPRPL